MGLLLAALAAGAEPTAPRDSLDLGKKRYPDVAGLAISPDGKTLAVLNHDALLDPNEVPITLWDVSTKRQVAAIKPEKWRAYRDFAFTSDGKALVVRGSRAEREAGAEVFRDSATVWDLATFKELRRIDFEHAPDLRGQALFTPDGKSMFLGTATRGVFLFDLETGKQTKALQCDGPLLILEVRGLALSSDGKTLAVGTRGGALFICDLEKGEVRHKIPKADDDYHDITQLAFAPDGKRLVSAGFDASQVQVWDPATGKNLDTLQLDHFVHRLSSLAYSPDGKTLAMGGVYSTEDEHGGTVELWDIGQFGFRDDFSGRSTKRGPVERLVFSPDGKTLVTAGMYAPVEFWDVPVGAPKGVRRDTNPPPPPPAPFTNKPGAAPPP